LVELPAGLRQADIAAIAIGRSNEVYLFNRGETPMVVLDRNGAARGPGAMEPSSTRTDFTSARTIHLYCTDDGDRTLRKCTLE
jgi:hypothetical protein